MKQTVIIFICLSLLIGCSNDKSENTLEKLIEYETEVLALYDVIDNQVMEIDLLNKKLENFEKDLKSIDEKLGTKVTEVEEKENQIKILETEKLNLQDNINGYINDLRDQKNELSYIKQNIDNGLYTMYIGRPISDGEDNQYSPFFIGDGVEKRIYKNWEGNQQVYFLGGSFEGKWYSLKDFEFKDEIHKKIDLIKSDSSYKIYSFNGFLREETIEYPIYRDWYTMDPISYQFIPELANKYNADIFVGIECSWNPQPRLPRVDLETGSIYIDIDGDNIEEVINRPQWSNIKEFEKLFWFLDYLDEEIVFDNSYYNLWQGHVYIDLNGDNKLEQITVYRETTGNGMIVSEYIDGEFIDVIRYDLGE